MSIKNIPTTATTFLKVLNFILMILNNKKNNIENITKAETNIIIQKGLLLIYSADPTKSAERFSEYIIIAEMQKQNIEIQPIITITIFLIFFIKCPPLL